MRLAVPPAGFEPAEVHYLSWVPHAIDAVVLQISLDQRTCSLTRAPGGQSMLWWLNLVTLLGWLLSSIFVVSLARTSSSS